MPKRRTSSARSSPELLEPAAKEPSGIRGGKDNSTRGRILDSAERLFAEQGFNGVSMPMIASASGITAGAIYKHFASKDDLFFEVVQRTVQSTPLPAGTADESGVMLLAHVVAAYSMRNLKLLRQLAVEVHSASARHPRVRRLLRRSVDLKIEQIRDAISAGQQAGELDPAVDAEFLASAVMVFTVGLMHMETIVPKFVGDSRWQHFVRDRIATMLGALTPDPGVREGEHGPED